MANVPNGGDLIQHREKNDQYSTVEGSDLPMNTSSNGGYLGSYAPADFGVDATNRLGSCDGTDSDPMFEQFNRKDNHSGGGDFAGSVSGVAQSGTDSDSMFRTDLGGADDNDTGGK